MQIQKKNKIPFCQTDRLLIVFVTLLFLLHAILAGCVHQSTMTTSVSTETSFLSTQNELTYPDLNIKEWHITEKDLELLEAELYHCFKFFYETANDDKNSCGYGLIPDRMPSGPDVCSIASVGYGLAALCIGDKRHFAPSDDLYERAKGTLCSLRDLPAKLNGFFYHFLDMKSGKRVWSCELSIIDTAICINGVLMAGAYFGGEVAELSHTIYERVQWDWFVNPETGCFYMGYKPESGFFGSWNMTAEQLMLYILGTGSPTYPTDPEMFYRFGRPKGSYGPLPDMIRSPTGSLFVYQSSHAWYDLRMKEDRFGVDWFENSMIASLSNRRYAIDQSERLNTGPNDWGFTACDGPYGYEGSYGAPPRAVVGREDGTIAPYGPAGSLVFIPEYALSALHHISETVPGIWGPWGYRDAYNRNFVPVWIASDVIGIDKGLTLLMIENYLTGFVWNTMSSVKSVQSGMNRVGLKLALNQNQPHIYAVLVDGGEFVGDSVRAVWHTWEPKGMSIDIVSIEWFTSKDTSGPWEPTDNARGNEFILSKQTAGRYILCKITGSVWDNEQYAGIITAESKPFGLVIQRK